MNRFGASSSSPFVLRSLRDHPEITITTRINNVPTGEVGVPGLSTGNSQCLSPIPNGLLGILGICLGLREPALRQSPGQLQFLFLCHLYYKYSLRSFFLSWFRLTLIEELAPPQQPPLVPHPYSFSSLNDSTL